jgi:HEAT repeat protein
VVGTFRQIGSASALEALVDLLGWDPELEASILDEMARFPPMALAALDDFSREHLRFRLNREDPAVRAAAIRLAAAIQDMRAVPQVVQLLEDPAGRVRSAALDALQHLSGKRLAPRIEDWSRWQAAEREWFEAEGAALLGALADAEPAEVLAAMRSVTAHRLYRREFVLALLDLLERDSPGVRRCAISSLRMLEAREAVAELIETLEDSEPGVRREAWRALVAITGEDLPAEPEVWEAALWRWQG